MRKWLIFIIALLALLLGAGLWLGSQADKGQPEPGEVRLEIENDF